eukprot:9155075-Pyramimonas_sp.AAC.1
MEQSYNDSVGYYSKQHAITWRPYQYSSGLLGPPGASWGLLGGSWGLLVAPGGLLGLPGVS